MEGFLELVSYLLKIQFVHFGLNAQI